MRIAQAISFTGHYHKCFPLYEGDYYDEDDFREWAIETNNTLSSPVNVEQLTKLLYYIHLLKLRDYACLVELEGFIDEYGLPVVLAGLNRQQSYLLRVPWFCWSKSKYRLNKLKEIKPFFAYLKTVSR